MIHTPKRFALVSASMILLLATIARAQYGSSESDSFALQRWEEPRSPYASVSLGNDPASYISFGGQARYRYDYFNNPTFGPGANDENGFHLQRYLLHADAHFGDHFRAFVQVDSSFVDDRVGGARYGDEQDFDLQQGFVDLATSSSAFPYAMLRLGRQELTYGAERFISPDDWRNVRRAFDGARLSISVPDNTLDFFLVRPVVIDPNAFDNDDYGSVFAGAYNVAALPDVFPDGNTKLETYLLYLNQTQHSTFNTGADAETYTAGVRFSTKPAPIDFDVEVDYQFGTYDTDRISAWSFATESGYTFLDAALSPRISAGFDIASGSSDPANRFNQLFPPTYTYLGHLYLFGRPNLIDAHVGVDLHLTKQLTLYVDQHVFWRQNTDDALYSLTNGIVRGDSGSDARYAGTEFDIALYWQMNKYVSAYIGYAHFFTGEFINETGPSRDVDFLYASITFTF